MMRVEISSPPNTAPTLVHLIRRWHEAQRPRGLGGIRSRRTLLVGVVGVHGFGDVVFVVADGDGRGVAAVGFSLLVQAVQLGLAGRGL